MKEYDIYLLDENREMKLFKQGIEQEELRVFLTSLDEWQRKSVLVEEVKEKKATADEVMQILNEQQWYK